MDWLIIFVLLTILLITFIPSFPKPGNEETR
jgi:hypothetical protein